MPPKRRRRFQGLYYHSSPPKVLPMNGQVNNSNGRRRRDPDDFSVKLSTIRIWMHEKDIGKLTRVLWAGQGTRLRQQASTNPKVKRFLAAVPYVMNSIKDVHQAVIDNNLETLQTHLEPPVPPALVTCRDANGLNLIHKAAGLGHATILEYLITTWPDGVHETDITGKTPLHWAASAKNNMRCYTLLTQAGCDEEAVDYKMKTPSYYRHKPNEIERAFLTYVPEAPRVSPDVSTDWEALSDDSGDGKKLDIKIPEMNGFGRHSNAESNENASEAEGASQEDEDMSKDGDQEPVDDKLEEEEEPSAEENENEADEKEPEPEPEAEAEPEPEPEHDPEPEQEPEPETTEATSEKEEEQTHEPEETKENEEDSNKDQTNETEDQNEKQPQQQTENLNENTENLSKDTPVAEIEEDGKSTQENVKENKEMEEEKSDKDNETDKVKQEDSEEKKETVEHSEEVKETSSIESSDSNKEAESKEADHMEQATENDKENEDKEKAHPAEEMETKVSKEQEKEQTTEETKTEKERNEKEIKENTGKPSTIIESKEMREQQNEQQETSQKTMNGDQDKLVDDQKSQEENVIQKTEEENKNEKEHDAEAGKPSEENKTNDKGQDNEQDKEQDTEVVKPLEDNKMNAKESTKEDIKDDKDIAKNGHGIGTKVEEEEDDDLKTVSEALENIKEEVKDNVKYLANQIQNLFTSDSDSEAKEKDDKEQREQENDKETKEPAAHGDADTKEIANTKQDETKDKTMENKTEDEKLKEKEIENKNDETNVSSITNDSENKTDQTTESSTSKLNTNETETTTNQAQSTIETLEIKQNTETPKTPQDQQTTAKTSEQPQTAEAGDKPSSAKQTLSTSDKPSSAKQTPSTSDKPHSAKQTPSTSDKPHSAQQKSPKKETEKTEEDENNNNNSKHNDNIAPDKETTDKEYQELNQALEQYKKEEKEEKEKEKEKDKEQDLSTDLGQKLEDMADSVKENVKEMTDKVKNIFSSNDNTTIDKQETEANDVIVHAVDASKLNGIKTNDKNMESSDDTGDEDEESRIQSIIATGDMEQLAQIVLNGDGQKLLNVEATEPEIQAFLRNVPNYMNKIRRVHEAARGGSLLNLQQALDRRKFAVAKDEISPNGATPLHVAVLFGHSDIVRYLSARFPETTTITDNDGRTPLHYAAVISDNGHFYNVLLQLGANPKLADKFGHTPEDYLSKEELKEKLNYSQLLKNFNAEELEQQLLSDQGQIENHSIQENPIFKTEQGKYLADNLADPLIKALTQVAQKRPSDPLQYLTNYLQNYAATRNTNGRTITQAAIHTGSSQTNSTILANSKSSTPPVQQQQQQQQQMARQTMRMNGHVRHDNSENMDDNDAMQRIEEYKDADGDNDDDGNDSEAEISRKLEERDEHGQSMLHFACARSHRKGGLIHLIEESKADITYRDELYRTARDVALQANQLGNAKEIDRYLMSLAIVGDIKPFEHFAINGYDHIIDVLDDNETPIIDVVASRGQNELAQYLRSIRPLEELREELHQMIRENKVERVKEIANGPNGRWLIKAKNYYGRTALHIAILKESIEIVEMFVKIAPEALKIGDNLERTPLHYGMGTNIFENISRILIQSGAKRTYKDLKGRQPSYYFMNKADILRLQEEEDENR